MLLVRADEVIKMQLLTSGIGTARPSARHCTIPTAIGGVARTRSDEPPCHIPTRR
jgi:hypothetical protein